MTAKLFEPLKLRDMQLSNRVVVSPMCQFSASEGVANDWHIMHIGQFATSNPGLIMLEGTAVAPEGRITKKDLCLYSSAHEVALERIISFIRNISKSKIGIQLFHSGRKGSQYPPVGIESAQANDSILPKSEGGWTGLAPSSIRFDDTFPTPKEASIEDLEQIKQDFVNSAIRADRIGLDTIELHFAHGYLLHTFLSAVSNKRNDKFGSNLKNRMRFPLEVFQAVREVWPQNKPLGARISGTDHGLEDESWTIADALIFSQELKNIGCDYLDVSSGFLSPNQKIENYGPGFQVNLAEKIKNTVGLPTFAVGVILNGHQANAIIQTGKADAVCIGRGMLYDPHWTWKAAHDLGEKPQFPPQYARAFSHYYPDMVAAADKTF